MCHMSPWFSICLLLVLIRGFLKKKLCFKVRSCHSDQYSNKPIEYS